MTEIPADLQKLIDENPKILEEFLKDKGLIKEKPKSKSKIDNIERIKQAVAYMQINKLTAVPLKNFDIKFNPEADKYCEDSGHEIIGKDLYLNRISEPIEKKLSRIAMKFYELNKELKSIKNERDSSREKIIKLMNEIGETKFEDRRLVINLEFIKTRRINSDLAKQMLSVNDYNSIVVETEMKKLDVRVKWK